MVKEKRRPPVRKNEELIVTCEDLTHEGSGVAKVNNYPLFIPYLLPGEKAKIKVVKVNKNFGYGKLLTLNKRSEHRVEPPCNVFYQCGGCQIQHMTYEAQLVMKQNYVKNSLNRIGKIADVIVHPVLGMDEPWYYRNKMQMPIGEKNGSLITGFYRERSHDIIPDMDTCLIQNKYGNQIIQAVTEIANDLKISAYVETRHQGILRHIIVRTAYDSNDMMIILVTKTKKLPQEAEIVKRLTRKFPKIKSIIQNVNPFRTNVILGDEERTLYGDGYIIDQIGNLKFKLSAKSFFQVNPTQTEVLYNKALEYAEIEKDDIVIDAYCGIGSISLFLAKKARKVYGVEVVPEAIEDARQNAIMNDISNVEFSVGKAEDVMEKWQQQQIKPDVIVVDPPRKGCDEKLLQAMIKMKPKRIVYVSCNPATLARDLRILEDGGFKTKEVQPVDMFSQTYHIECVALLSRE